jgi:hypothetical protein
MELNQFQLSSPGSACTFWCNNSTAFGKQQKVLTFSSTWIEPCCTSSQGTNTWGRKIVVYRAWNKVDQNGVSS